MATIQLKALATQRKLSLKQIATDTGISYAVVHRYANQNSTGIQLDDLEKLAHYLKVYVEELIKLDKPVRKPRQK